MATSSFPKKFKSRLLKMKVPWYSIKISTKTFIFSLFFLLILNLIFYFLLYFYLNPKQNPITSDNYEPVTSQPVSLTLNISSPDDNQLVFDKNLLVQGTTIPGSLVLITNNLDQQMITSRSKGDFSTTLILSPGINQISVSVFDDLGNTKQEIKTIYYSEEKI